MLVQKIRDSEKHHREAYNNDRGQDNVTISAAEEERQL